MYMYIIIIIIMYGLGTVVRCAVCMLPPGGALLSLGVLLGEGVKSEENEDGSLKSAGQRSDPLCRGQQSDLSRRGQERREQIEVMEREMAVLRGVVGSSDGLLLDLEAGSLWEGVACIDSTYNWTAMHHVCQRLYKVLCVYQNCV